jgi:hypothetical protein
MGAGDTDAAAAAEQLKVLAAEFTTRRRRPQTTDAVSVSRPAHSPALFDLGVGEYMRAKVDEVITHTRAMEPNAGPAPTGPAVYNWWDQNTAHLEREKRQAGEAIVVRQSLEHSIAMGEEHVVQSWVRRQQCPSCACWGLFWSRAMRRATCVNRRCTDRHDRAHTFSLARLAAQHVAAREKSAVRAT